MSQGPRSRHLVRFGFGGTIGNRYAVQVMPHLLSIESTPLRGCKPRCKHRANAKRAGRGF